jgi:hypothetical protein
MVQKNLRSVMGLFQRSNESLPQMVDGSIQCPVRPNQSLYSWCAMGIRYFIESTLSYKKRQCVEGVWEHNGWCLPQVERTDAPNWVRTTRYTFVVEELLDKRYSSELQRNQVARTPTART